MKIALIRRRMSARSRWSESAVGANVEVAIAAPGISPKLNSRPPSRVPVVRMSGGISGIRLAVDSVGALRAFGANPPYALPRPDHRRRDALDHHVDAGWLAAGQRALDRAA